MPKSVNVQLSQLVFPKTCAVCLSPASKEYRQEGTITYGRRTYTVHVQVPMCESHYEAAGYKSPAERLVNWLAIFGGGFFGLLCGILLIFRWETNEHILFKLFGGGIFALGVFAIFWWIVTDSVAPLFASARSKEARTAVRILHYWPQNQIAQLEFRHESLADMVQKTN